MPIPTNRRPTKLKSTPRLNAVRGFIPGRQLHLEIGPGSCFSGCDCALPSGTRCSSRLTNGIPLRFVSIVSLVPDTGGESKGRPQGSPLHPTPLPPLQRDGEHSPAISVSVVSSCYLVYKMESSDCCYSAFGSRTKGRRPVVMMPR